MHIVGARSPIAGGVDNGGLATPGSVFVAGGDVGDGSVPVGLDNLGNLADSIAGGVKPLHRWALFVQLCRICKGTIKAINGNASSSNPKFLLAQCCWLTATIPGKAGD